MAANEPIQSVLVTTAVPTITFTQISQTYTDLVISINGKFVEGSGGLSVRFNGDTGSTRYGFTYLYNPNSNNTTMSVNTVSAQDVMNCGNISNTNTSTVHMHINNYTHPTLNKSFLSECTDGVDNYAIFYAGSWQGTAPITSITFFNVSNYNFTPGTTIDIYGIKSGSPKALGGDVIVRDATHWYHAFRSSGIFSPQQVLSADVLVVAGGGGSGQNNGGGGGAGGLVYTSGITFAHSTNYTVSIGAGGAGATSASDLTSRGSNGSNSNITGGSLSLTAAVGGGGAGGQGTGGNALSGGSGGGGGNGSNVRATGTSGQGNSGGLGVNTNRFPGGGGGGAGAAGGDANGAGTTGGQGGNGSSAYSSWGMLTKTGHNVSGVYYYAGGGSGAGNTALAGGYGGGGTGGIYQGSPDIGTAGMANTGGGAGGSTGSSGVSSITGGSGIIIVRYPV